MPADGTASAAAGEEDPSTAFLRSLLQQQVDKMAFLNEQLAASNGSDSAADEALEKQLIEAAKAATALERELAETTGAADSRRSVQALEGHLARLQARMQQVQASSAATGSTADVIAGVQLSRRYRIMAAALKEIR